MKVGWAIPQSSVKPEESLRFSQRCEELGYHSLWVYDHLMPYWLRGKPSFEAWTLLSALAARTSRIRIGTLVTNVTLRSPSILAKMAATVDRISNGRLTLGLGTGDILSRGELEAYGFRYLPWATRLRTIRLTIELLRKVWTGEETYIDEPEARFHGISRPTPAGKIPIWIGGKHPELGRLAVESADGWNLWGIPFGEIRTRIDAVRSRIRKPSEFELSWAGGLSRSRTANQKIESRKEVAGTTDQIESQIEFLASIGISHVVFYPAPGRELSLLEWFSDRIRAG